ncbi:MAG: hypothetical protein ABI647_24995 [Gemmatimonadota bacterium]
MRRLTLARFARPVRGVAASALVGLVLLGCGSDRSAWQQTLAEPRVQGMVGLWAVELRLDRPGSDPMPQRAAGMISLTLNEEGNSAPGFGGPPMLFGTYDIAFRTFAPLGYEPLPNEGIPAVVGRVRGDSVDLRLAPGGKVTITMTGVLGTDSIAGRWATEYRRAGNEGTGQFVLRRR